MFRQQDRSAWHLKTNKSEKQRNKTMSEAARIETTESSFCIDATYSPEDNKLRLYSLHRFDDEIYDSVAIS